MVRALPTETFCRELRRALYRLYDPVVLRKSPLRDLLGLREASALALQRALMEAIEAIRPEASISPNSDAWRTYEILSHRFVDQFSQQEVAVNLGLSIRQMRRQERVALQTLAAHIWDAYELAEREAVPEGAAEGQAPPADGSGIDSSTQSELEWLEQSYHEEVTVLQDVIPPILALIKPLCDSLRVELLCGDVPATYRVAVQPGVLRQGLLSLLSAAIRSAPGGQVRVDVYAEDRQVCLEIAVDRRQPEEWLDGDGQAALHMAEHLSQMMKGELEAAAGEDRSVSTFRLRLPLVRQSAELFVDDNSDALQLYERFLHGSDYYYVGTRDPRAALDLAQDHAPKMIVLDLMLPNVDGWELLARFREHPDMAGVPVVVCSIMPLQQLALTLGASSFLQKPVKREELLAMLDRNVSRSAGT